MKPKTNLRIPLKRGHVKMLEELKEILPPFNIAEELLEEGGYYLNNRVELNRLRELYLQWSKEREDQILW